MTQFHKYNELELFLLIAAGNEIAFRNLVNNYNPVLFPGIYKIVKDTAVSEDIVQETYLRIWLCRDKLPSIENPRGWILKIAYLRAFTFLGTQKKQLRLKENLTGDLAGSHVEMENGPDFNTLSNLVKMAVSKLPVQQRRVYKLSREYGYSQTDIADMVGVAPQFVNITMRRSLQFIRDYIRKKGYPLLTFSFLFF